LYLAAASTALMALPLVWGEIAEAHAMLFFEMGNHGSMAPSFAVVPQSDIPDCLRTATAARGPESCLTTCRERRALQLIRLWSGRHKPGDGKRFAKVRVRPPAMYKQQALRREIGHYRIGVEAPTTGIGMGGRAKIVPISPRGH